MCNCTHTLEVCHIKDLQDYPLSTKSVDVNNTDVTAPLCKGCHGILDGNKHIKASTFYSKWIKKFKRVHDKFRTKYRIKAIG